MESVEVAKTPEVVETQERGSSPVASGSDVEKSGVQSSLNAAAALEDSRHDDALEFLNEHKNEHSVEQSKVASFTKALRTKIDWRVMPFLFLVYLLTFIDKVLLNYARIMGLVTQLSLTNDDYSNASSCFYIAVLIFSLPNVWLLNRLPVAKCLAVNLIGWAICTACHAAVKNFAGLVAVRVLSGIFESGIPPALMLLTGQYFTYAEQSVRFAYWYLGMGFGQILGALVSWGFQHMTSADTLSGWRTMFLTLGLITLLLGVFVFLFVPDTPMKARFLSNDEKVALLEHIKVNQTGVDGKRFHWNQVLEGILDPGHWGVFILIALQTIGSGVVTAYSATILTSYGYTPQQSALLSMPTGAVNIVATLAWATYVRYYGGRWFIQVFAGIIATTGAALMSFLPLSNKAGLLAGMYLLNVLPGATSIAFHWLVCNTAGHTKRTYATAGMNAAFAIGNIIGPLTFRAVDAPNYYPAKLTLTICWAVAIVIGALTGAYWFFMNKYRSSKQSEESQEEVTDVKAYAGLTDKQNPNFVYHL